jgi:hypothetical protein
MRAHAGLVMGPKIELGQPERYGPMTPTLFWDYSPCISLSEIGGLHRENPTVRVRDGPQSEACATTQG